MCELQPKRFQRAAFGASFPQEIKAIPLVSSSLDKNGAQLLDKCHKWVFGNVCMFCTSSCVMAGILRELLEYKMQSLVGNRLFYTA